MYATLLLILAKLWAGFEPNSRVATFSANSKQFWWRSGFAASMVLFLIVTTSWGDHGLESARIPLGYGLVVERIDGADGPVAYLEPVSITDQTQIIAKIAAYQVAGNMLCARDDNNRYFSYNLDTRQHRVFADSIAYNSVAKNLGWPLITKFESFHEHYARYWGGWRFWLLA